MRVAVIATVVAFMAAAPAAAHVGVKSYSPKRGATVSRSLERVKVTFKGRITDGKLTVRNADGDKVSIGQGKVVNRKRAVRARPAGRPAEGHLQGLDERAAQRRPRHEQVLDLQAQVRNHTMKKTALAAVAAAALAVPAAASAHVTLQPREAAAGSFSKMDVRVPNERDNKGTIKVDVRFPDGFYFLSYQKVPGWKARVYREKLDRPVDLGGFEVDEQYTRIVWTARKPKRDRIAPGQFQDFPLSVRVPEGAAGSQLVLPRVPDLPARRARGLDGRAGQRLAGPARDAARRRGGLNEVCARVQSFLRNTTVKGGIYW